MLPRLLQGNKLNNVFVARSNGISRKANWSRLEGSCRNMGAVWLCGSRGCIPRWSVCVLAGGRAGSVLRVSWSPGWGCAGDVPLPERVVPLAPKSDADVMGSRRPLPGEHPCVSTRGGNLVLRRSLAWSVTSTVGSAFGNGPWDADVGRTEGEEGTEGLPDWARRLEDIGGAMWTDIMQKPAPVSNAELLQESMF